MSFDLALWYQAVPLTPEYAYSIYDRLTDGIHGVVEASPAVERFYEDIVAVYPDPDEELEDDSPWAAGIYRSQECVLLSISWSRKDEVTDVVLRLARETGLIVYDPQSRAVCSAIWSDDDRV